MPPPPLGRPLVGRTDELRRLRAAVGLGPKPTGGVAVVSGDAGIGKSRLLTEVVDEAGRAGWTVAVGHCIGQSGSAIAYLPFVELLGALQQAHPDLLASVTAAHPALALLLPGQGQAPTVSATADPGRIAEAVHACLTAVGRDHPLLAVVEDVHWADHSSRDLLTLLLTRGFTGPTGLVVTYRADDLHRRHPLHETLPLWSRIPQLSSIELTALPPQEMLALISALDGAPTDQATLHSLVDRAEGNAFFAEELVVASAHRRGHQRTTEGLARLLRVRLEQLDREAATVVHAAAVGGRTVSHELLAKVAGLGDDALDAALTAAVEHHVLEVAGAGYAFRHALLGETVAGDLLPGARRRLHQAYLTALTADPGLGSPADLARHAAAAGDREVATCATLAAGDAAMAIGGPRDALGHYEAALQWIDDVPGRVDATLRAANAATVGGDPVRGVELLRDALVTTPAAAYPGERAEVLSELAARLRAVDLPGDPLGAAAEAVAIVPPAPARRRARVLGSRAHALLDARQLDEATEVADQLAALADELGDPSLDAEARLLRSFLLEARSDLDSAAERLEALLTQLEHTDDPLQIRALVRLNAIRLRQGRLREALAAGERGWSAAQRLGRPWAMYAMESRLFSAVVAQQLGEWDRVIELTDTSDEHVVPQPGGSLLASLRLLVEAGRGQPVALGELHALRQWWPVDSLVTVYTLHPAIEGLPADQMPALAELVDAGVDELEQAWSVTFRHAYVRVAAELVGRVVDLAPTLDGPTREHMVGLADRHARRALEGVAAVMTPAPQDEAGTGISNSETLAWAARLRVEALRLRALQGERVEAERLVFGWSDAVAAMAAYGNVPETARAQARLAVALRDAGRADEADVPAAEALAVAQRIGMQPVVDLLEGSPDPAPQPEPEARGAGDALPELTPREREVLALVVEGRTNGEIGAALFISTKTVSVHVSNLLAKLGAATRGEAAAIARRAGFDAPHDPHP